MLPPSLLPLTVASLLLLLLPSTQADGIYPKSSGVLSVDGRSYRELIEKSNHTSIVEFYAPWCGHCQNLKPAYEKAATSLTGLAKVAAVNCDDEANKPFCGSMGVQGFPTLKIVRPGKKVGKPTVEDYQGARTAKGIVDAVVEKIPNHVKRLKDSDYEAWLEEGAERPKAILFSDKGTVSALLKAIAVDYLGVMDVAQIRNKEIEAVEVFNVEKFPTLVLLPGEGKDPVHYEGEMKKEAMLSFLSQAASPNPDPAPKAKKDSKSKSSSTDKSKASKASSSFSKASASHESADSQSAKASQTAETLEHEPTESPNPQVEHQQPVKVPDIAPPISTLPDGLSLQQKCLNTKAGTCILALLPASAATNDWVGKGEGWINAVASLSDIHHKHTQAKRNLFPFYQLPHTNSQAAALRSKLGLGSADNVELIALNGKKSWYRHYTKSTFSPAEVEDWIDAIRMGDVAKQDVPAGLIMPAENLPAEPVRLDFSDPEALRNAMKGQLPEGVDFEMEEIDDEAYERLTRRSKEAGEKKEGGKADSVVGEETVTPEDEKAEVRDEHDEL